MDGLFRIYCSDASQNLLVTSIRESRLKGFVEVLSEPTLISEPVSSDVGENELDVRMLYIPLTQIVRIEQLIPEVGREVLDGRYLKRRIAARTMTFDNFCVGPSNQGAYEAVRDVLNARTRNRKLLISANAGMGKTHLLIALEDVLQSSPLNKVVEYFSGESLINVLGEHTPRQFARQSLKGVEFVLLDDVHTLLEGEDKDAFFELINQIVLSGKCLVMSADLNAIEVDEDGVIDSRLCSPQEVVEIAEFDRSVAEQLVRTRAEERGMLLSHEIARYVVQRRAMDGHLVERCLDRVELVSRLNRRPVDMKMIHDVL